jgi:hypothetical protein
VNWEKHIQMPTQRSRALPGTVALPFLLNACGLGVFFNRSRFECGSFASQGCPEVIPMLTLPLA